MVFVIRKILNTKESPMASGFTLVELLAVVALIGILIGITGGIYQYALESSKGALERVSLKQLIQGWNFYASENNGKVVSGYGGERSVQNDCQEDYGEMKAPDGSSLGCPEDGVGGTASCYPYAWRLTPYLEDAWETLFTVQDKDELNELALQGNWYGLGFRTSFGVNSEWIGGDRRSTNQYVFCQYPETAEQQGYVLQDRFVSRFSQIKRASLLLLFAASMDTDDTATLLQEQDFSNFSKGSCTVSSPIRYMPNNQASFPPWEEAPLYSQDIGQLSIRNGGLALYGSPDGSVKSTSFESLKDMKYWRN